jgi:branched chain amino acid efflux pump
VVHRRRLDYRRYRGGLLRRAGRMNSELGTFGTWMAILAMAAVTYAIRAGGFWLMGYVPLTRRVRSILNALPGSVVVAVILPLAVRGGTAATLAVLTSLVVMALRRNDLLAVVCGMGVAALVRAF